jgi:hypothetical protein
MRLLVLCLLGGLACAQTWRGAISGFVRDSSERAIPEATVSLLEEQTGRKRQARAASDGAYIFFGLPPGLYRIHASAPQLASPSPQISLGVNQEVRLDLTLVPEARADAVSVTGAPELLKTESASLSTIVNLRQVRDLPLDGRNFYELALLAPGVLPPAPGSANTVRGDFAVSINGAREDATSFLLDGIYNVDAKLNGVAVTPSVDAIREFEILTSTYDASFGRNGGGQINVVLLSGTNQLHGTAYEFFRNHIFDARNTFAPVDQPLPRRQRHQFGASLGGPLHRNRTFFFGDYEGRRLREAVTRITNVPTLLERNGDFSQTGVLILDLVAGAPFASNRIPASRIHPVGRNLLLLYPLPNRPVSGENFASSPLRRDRSDSFDLRLDHQLSSAGDLMFRYSFNDRTLYEPFSGPTYAQIPGFGSDIERRGQNAVLAHTQAFSPRLLNDARVGFSRVAQGVWQQNRRRNFNAEVGLPFLSRNTRDYGLSLISLPGYSPLGDESNNPQHGVINSYQLIDHLSWSSGRHTLKLGGDSRFNQQNAFRDVQSRGLLVFTGFTGHPAADLLQGLPSVTGIALLDNHQNLRTRSYAAFVQGTHRLHPSLTLNLGLRYEYNSPPVDVRDRANLYDLSTGRLAPVGQGAMPRAGYLPDRNNWAPRLGLAWMLKPASTVVRAGYGLYYDQAPLAPGEGLYFSPPYFDFRLFIPAPGAPLTLSDPFPAAHPFALPNSALAFQRDLRTGYLQHWNFTLQQRLTRTGSLELGYVGSKGTKLLAARDINQPRPSPVRPNLRPNPLFDDISIIESRGNSVYHSLQTKFTHQLSHSISVLASYTFGKSIDDASGFFPSAADPNFPQDSYNLRAERGRSGFDIRHRLSLSYSWLLPFRRNRWIAGWQAGGIWTLQSGRPFTVTLHPDIDNSNTGRSTLGFGANDRPDVIANPGLPHPQPSRWFRTEAFRVPSFGSFGNAGRNILEGPALNALNASLLKNLSWTESFTTQLRVEAFNVLNHVNYDLPGIYVGAPNFGRITSAQEARSIQFGLKLLW